MAALAVGLAACSESGGTPVAPEADIAPQFSARGKSPLRPNGVPYTDPAYKHGTGRSGGAQLSARALLGSDGSTDLEVTTGEIDGAAGAQNISKLQLKLFSPLEQDIGVENHNKVNAPSAAFSFPNLMRHATIRVQGNVDVDNVKGKRRTGVVTITERVNLRPDLAALALIGPAQAVPGMPVTFQANVAEINGDLSATADCVFYVDGVEASRANGIWVGEGDMVHCGFAFAFPNPGTYTVSVSVDNVNPGDWSLANNDASHTIEIVNPEIQLHGSASASESHYTNSYTFDHEYHFADGNGYQKGEHRTWNINEHHDTHAYLSAWAPGAASYPISYSVEQSTEGWTFDQASGSASGPGCVSHFTGKTSIQICPGDEGLSVTAQLFTGRAYYYTGTYLDFHRCQSYPETGWTCITDAHEDSYVLSDYPWGTGTLTLGADHTWEVEVNTANGTRFVANPSVLLTTFFSHVEGQPEVCDTLAGDYGYMSTCTAWSSSQVFRSGFISF